MWWTGSVLLSRGSTDGASTPSSRRPRPTNVRTQASLHQHRTCDVRLALRHALLAYGFLRGLEYERLERRTSAAPNFEEVRKIAERFGPGVPARATDGFSPWRDRAKAFLASQKPQEAPADLSLVVGA